jgi:hypothetical protein
MPHGWQLSEDATGPIMVLTSENRFEPIHSFVFVRAKLSAQLQSQAELDFSCPKP